MILPTPRRLITPPRHLWTPDRKILSLVPGIIAGGAGGAAPPPPTDPLFAFVKALLHMDGANGGTTFTDVIGHTFVPGNAPTTVTGSPAPKFGTASGKFQGGASRSLQCTHADFQLVQLLTIETWFYAPSLGQNHFPLISLTWNGGSAICTFGVTSGNKVQLTRGGTITGTTNITANAWHHIAFSRDITDTTRIFLNGNLEASGSTSFVASIPTYGIMISEGDAWLDDLRVTFGACRYTANFTPPVAAFPDS